MLITEVMTKDGNGVLPTPFSSLKNGNQVTHITIKKTEMTMQSYHETLNYLVFLIYKSISAFFNKNIKSLSGCYFGNGALKHAISVHFRHFRHSKGGI